MSRITDYPQIPLVDPADVLPIVDVDDTTSSPAGTTKAVTVAKLTASISPPLPMTTRGDMLFESAGLQPTRLPPNTTTTRKFMRQAGDGTNAGDPGWDTFQAGDIPQLAQYNPLGLTGATAPTSYAGGTTGGHPLAGTWTQGQWVVDWPNATIWVCVASGTQGTWRRVGRNPNQFFPEDFGAARDGALLYDVSIASGGTDLTTVGLPTPPAPTLSQSGTGGPLTGTYQARTTYVNQYGESLASASASITVNGAVSITVSHPAPWSDAIGWYTYLTGPGGSVFTRQQPAGQPTTFRFNLILTAVTSSGANPPVANTSASSPFQVTDVGKAVVIPSAGGGLNLPLAATITGFVSSQHVTLSTAATSAVATGGAVYGSDDTLAWQRCFNAAVAYAQNQVTFTSPAVDIVLTSGLYCMAGTPGRVNAVNQNWNWALLGAQGLGGNGIVTYPFVDPTTSFKVDFRILAPALAGAPVHWEQSNPQLTGAMVVCMRTDGTNDGTYGPASVIGGPTLIGGANSLYSNMRVVVDGLNILVPFRPSYSGMDCAGIAQADIISMGYFCLANPVADNQGGWPPYQGGQTYGTIVPWQVFGYRAPVSGNNARSTITRLTTYGAYHGFIFTDHLSADTVECVFGFASATTYGGAVGGNHHCTIKSLCSEAISRPVYAPTSSPFTGMNQSGSQGLTIASLQVENADAIIDDANNILFGSVNFETLGVGGAPGQPPVMVPNGKNGARNLKLWLDYQPLGITASPAPAASGATLVNQYWQNAMVKISGGAVSDVSVDGLSYGVPTVPIPWPNGSGLKITYTVAPTLSAVLG